MYDLLKDLTIVEGAAFIAGPSCALYFAQMGAKVIRFDQIGGGPDANRWPHGEHGESLYWEGLNKGKRSIALDLGRPEGRELAQRIATSGDGLFVTNFPVEGFLSYEKLAKLRADLICLRIMGWADGTPAVDYTVNAAVGIPMMTGPADDTTRPTNHVFQAWDFLAGAFGAFSLLAAHHDRRATGKGREVRLALSDLAASTVAHLGWTTEAQMAGRDRPKAGNDLYAAFGRDFPTADGQRLMLVAITKRQWAGMLEVLGIAEPVSALQARLGVDFAADEASRWVHRAELVPIVSDAIATKTVAELAPTFDRLGVCWSIYRTLHQALTAEPKLFAENPIFSQVTHGGGTTYMTPGYAARLPQDERRPPAPAVKQGHNTDEVLADLLGLGSGEIGRLHDQGLVA